jgi:hypothetical protein
MMDDELAVEHAANEWYEHYRATGVVVTEQQIIIAAEVTNRSPDFGQLEPMVNAALGEPNRPG